MLSNQNNPLFSLEPMCLSPFLPIDKLQREVKKRASFDLIFECYEYDTILSLYITNRMILDTFDHCVITATNSNPLLLPL